VFSLRNSEFARVAMDTVSGSNSLTVALEVYSYIRRPY
jgi:hypothetical protein